MANRSIEIYGMAHAASEKFDYFICSVAGALFAYIVQTYSPQKIDTVFSALQTLSLIFLAGSFYYGVRRIQNYNVLTRLNQKILDASEKAGELTKVLLSDPPPGSSCHLEGGKVYDIPTLEKMRSDLMEEKKRLENLLQKVKSKVSRYYKARDYLLLFGFLTIFAAKVSQPYQQNFSTQVTTVSTETNAPARSILPPTNSTNNP